MKELTILHSPASNGGSAKVRVSYRHESGAQAQEREADFQFAVSPDERRLIQWYLEEYLLYP